MIRLAVLTHLGWLGGEGLLPTRESALEIGVVSLGLTLACGLGMLVVGELLGRAGRAKGKRAGPPAPGSLPPQRHRNVSAVSTR